jgi:hypothetical protein
MIFKNKKLESASFKKSLQSACFKKKVLKKSKKPFKCALKKVSRGPFTCAQTKTICRKRQYVGKSNSARPPNPERAQNDFLYMKKKKLLKFLEPCRN